MLKHRRRASARPPAGGAVGLPGESVSLRTRAHELIVALLDGFKQHDLLTYASAISFQILTAVIPFLLFVLAVAGLLHLSSIWHDHLEPQIQRNTSAAVFTVVRDAVDNVFGSRRVLWATFGGALALWQVSGAVRAVMGALARIYGAASERSFVRHYAISFALSIEVGGCFILAGLAFGLAPFLSMAHPDVAWSVFAFVVRWILVIGLLLLAVGILVRHAPATAQTVPWVTLGATIVIVCWLLVSVLFALYLAEIASYQSVFGSLATVIVAMAYLYISTTVFLFGAQLDAILRAQATGALSGVTAAPAGAGKRTVPGSRAA
jgi:membrane protein